MRRSVQPNIPNAMTCCFFDSFKTLLMPTEPTRSVAINVSKRLLPLAGFQVIIIGRFWVITEGQIDLRKLIHRDEQSLRAHEHPVGAVSFSPSGERIAILVGVHPKENPKEKGYRSDLVVVDANHLDQIVRKFEISDPPFGGLDEPQIQRSLDGKRMALGGKVFPIEGPSYCGRGEVRGFLGADRFLAFIPSEMVRLFGVGREQPARRLYLVGPGCDDEVRVPTHELNWFLEDFSAQRNIALFDRLHGPLNQRVHEFIVVQFPEGSILHSWEVGINGRFVNGGSDVCLGSALTR